MDTKLKPDLIVKFINTEFETKIKPMLNDNSIKYTILSSNATHTTISIPYKYWLQFQENLKQINIKEINIIPVKLSGKFKPVGEDESNETKERLFNKIFKPGIPAGIISAYKENFNLIKNKDQHEKLTQWLNENNYEYIVGVGSYNKILEMSVIIHNITREELSDISNLFQQNIYIYYDGYDSLQIWEKEELVNETSKFNITYNVPTDKDFSLFNNVYFHINF